MAPSRIKVPTLKRRLYAGTEATASLWKPYLQKKSFSYGIALASKVETEDAIVAPSNSQRSSRVFSQQKSPMASIDHCSVLNIVSLEAFFTIRRR